MGAGAGESCISRQSPDRRRSRVSAVRHESAARPNAGFACAIVRISVRRSAGTVGRPMRRRLFQVHHSRKPRRCQAMTVSGLTRTSAVRHPFRMCESTTQSQRSVLASRTRRVRCSTCSWCRNASTSSWSAARERAKVRRVRRNESITDILAEKRSHRRSATSTAPTRTDFSAGTT
jgi:hypothetical protein